MHSDLRRAFKRQTHRRPLIAQAENVSILEITFFHFTNCCYACLNVFIASFYLQATSELVNPQDFQVISVKNSTV